MAAPIDPRLWRYSRQARRYLVLSVGLTVVSAAAMIVAALAIGGIVGGVVADPALRSIGAWTAELSLLAAAFLVRGGAAWLQARFGHRAATSVVAELEGAALTAAVALPVREIDSRSAELTTVLTRGVADLRPYLAGYLPALVSAVIVPPALIAVIAMQDPTSAAIVVGTLPLIPVFMILIGLLTKGKAAQTLDAMSTLSGRILDLLAGIPTLRALGREKGPEARVAALGEAHRRKAMSALRIAFLSSMVLEMLATLCVALVAVGIGLRLVFGDMGLTAGLVVLVLAPEVYAPLRAVGEKFHAAEDGMAAARKIFEVFEESAAAPVGRIRPRRCNGVIEVAGLSVPARGRNAPHKLSAVLRPGMVTVVTGPNGSGKSTALQAILGLTDAHAGRITVDGIDLAALDLDWWWDCVAWLPQRPALVPGTLRDNLELAGSLGADPRVVEQACAATGFDVDAFPDGWDTVVGTGGLGLSLGQRQRLALTRLLAAGKPILLLDEPTAHLDEKTEATVLNSLVAYAENGATVVIVGHRPAVLAVADTIVKVADDDPD